FFGEERTVALVTLLAHASFQDRIFLALNVAVEPGGPPPPLAVSFAKPKPREAGAAPAAKPEKTAPAAKGAAAGPGWLGPRAGLGQQRARRGRIGVPSKEEVRNRLGDKHPALWQSDILWSRVCYGNQPELTDAWFACGLAFGEESKQDRVFGQ